jgi:hypothetical protein
MAFIQQSLQVHWSRFMAQRAKHVGHARETGHCEPGYERPGCSLCLQKQK